MGGEAKVQDAESPEVKPDGVAGCPCPIKCICCPCLLWWLSCKLLYMPCIGSYCRRFWSCCVCKCCRYTDKNFPAKPASLGGEFAAKPVTWVRASEMGEAGSMVLFQGDVAPSDVKQGGVGNCWLMSSFACLAEYPGALQNVFCQREKSERGKYTVRLFDNGTPIELSVDDFIPCDERERPLFSRPEKNEMWVMLLEKAVAKFCGSYSNLSGGNTVWGLALLTGDPSFCLKIEDSGPTKGHWRRHNCKTEGREDRKCYVFRTEEVFHPDKTFDILFEYNKKSALMAASAHSDDGDKEKTGIVQKHAYTILDVRVVDGNKLMRLRNPWGSFEWKGRWSDDWPGWEQHKSVKQALGQHQADDGMFWMDFSDFAQHFTKIDLVDRSVGEHDLALRIDEEQGCIGPCCGCVKGCCRFWCCCEGCKVLCCSRKGTGITRAGKRGCCSDG